MTEDKMKKSNWQHLKQGGVYEVVGLATGQDSYEGPAPGRGVEGEVFVVYRAQEGGRLWVRRKREFLDGRFRQLALGHSDR